MMLKLLPNKHCVRWFYDAGGRDLSDLRCAKELAAELSHGPGTRQKQNKTKNNITKWY